MSRDVKITSSSGAGIFRPLLWECVVVVVIYTDSQEWCLECLYDAFFCIFDEKKRSIIL